MAFGEQTIVASVYNRVPFITNNGTNTPVIESFASEVMGELYKPFGLLLADKFDETKYNQAQKSLVADMTAISFIKKRILSNMEGVGDAGVSNTRLLKKAKAGEVETEFMIGKAEEGVRLQATATTLCGELMAEANRKALSMGFILDLQYASPEVIEAYSKPIQGFIVASFDEE
jgi:hypothetical protein